jgi:hypothetical protein
LFERVIELELREIMLFCSTAAGEVVGKGIIRIEGGYVKSEARRTITADGWKSNLTAKDSMDRAGWAPLLMAM